MSTDRSKMIWVTVVSALAGALGTLFYVGLFSQTKSSTQLSGKRDSSPVIEPRWQNPGTRSENNFGEPKDSLTAQNQHTLTHRKPKLETPPDAAQVREEVALDSHATPRSLIEFAEEVGESVQTAYGNKEARYNVTRQLINCAKDAQARGTAQAARALCLTSFERLKAKFPNELTPDYLSLIEELPDELLFVAGINKAKEEK